jgi:uncharacterized phiE125 gp8 family phage protein
MRYSLILAADGGPEVPVVTLAEAKAQCRIDDDSEDTLLQRYLDAAIEGLDGKDGTLGRALITQSWLLKLEAFADPSRCSRVRRPGEIVLPLGSLLAVTSIVYLDAHGTEQSLPIDDYRVIDRGDELSSIMPAHGKSWPSTYCDEQAVTIAFTCGYGDAAADVPARIRSAILAAVDDLYKNRGGADFGEVSENVMKAIANLTDRYRLTWF